MIRVLANKVLAFPNPNGEKDAKGNLIKVKTKVGYCPLPDWVEADPYYKMAVADGSIKSFNASSNDEETLKLQEKREALRKEIEELGKIARTAYSIADRERDIRIEAKRSTKKAKPPSASPFTTGTAIKQERAPAAGAQDPVS